MIVLDASVLIAHLNSADAHHRAATELLLESEPESLVMHSMTLVEVLVGGARAGRAAMMREDVRAMRIRVGTPDEDEPLRLAELRATTRLRLPDCCVLDTAVVAGATLATFDQELAAAAQARGVVVQP